MLHVWVPEKENYVLSDIEVTPNTFGKADFIGISQEKTAKWPSGTGTALEPNPAW